VAPHILAAALRTAAAVRAVRCARVHAVAMCIEKQVSMTPRDRIMPSKRLSTTKTSYPSHRCSAKNKYVVIA
jgi:hypothetical protein